MEWQKKNWRERKQLRYAHQRKYLHIVVHDGKVNSAEWTTEKYKEVFSLHKIMRKKLLIERYTLCLRLQHISPASTETVDRGDIL